MNVGRFDRYPDGGFFGFSVSIDGDYAIVGALYDGDNGTNSGSAYVYEY
jgi:hypothetical protein